MRKRTSIVLLLFMMASQLAAGGWQLAESGVSPAVSRQPPASARADIDRFIAATLRTFPEAPGVSVAVVKDGKPYFAAGYGFADLAAKRGMTAVTPVYIASSTKSFTGLMCAMLAAEGKLDFDKPIVTYLPELDSWADAHRITTRMLLTHSAGIRNDAIVRRTAFTGIYTPEELVRLLPSSKAIEPKFRYDNLGYVVAALIAERITGEKWQDLLAQKIFTPLGMKNTTAYMSRVRGLATPYNSIHASAAEPIANLKTDATMHPAGGVVTTANDLQRWLAANIAEPSAPYREAHKQQVPVADVDWYKFRRYAYGFGWYWSDYEGDLLMHHFGGFEGWRAHVSYMPKPRIGVAVVTNTSGIGSDVADLVAAYIYDRVMKKPDLEAKYVARSAEMRKLNDEQWQRIAADVEKRSKRAPTLTRDPAAYVGIYENPQYGKLSIVKDGNVLRATIGQLSARLEPFTAPDTARVELIPGSGQVVKFQFGEAVQAAALDWSGDVFTRVP
jgi:CubicO group peptidase (beta-lactamase class C family)